MLAAVGALAVRAAFPPSKCSSPRRQRTARCATSWIGWPERPRTLEPAPSWPYRLSAVAAAAVSLEPGSRARAQPTDRPSRGGGDKPAAPRTARPRLGRASARIATTLHDEDRLLEALDACRRRRGGGHRPRPQPRTAAEAQLRRPVGRRCSGSSRWDPTTTSSSWGGHSPLVVELISRIGRRFQVELPLAACSRRQPWRAWRRRSRPARPSRTAAVGGRVSCHAPRPGRQTPPALSADRSQQPTGWP